MKEEEMKKLRCISPNPENTGIWVTVRELPASGFYACSGSECAGWVHETEIGEITLVDGERESQVPCPVRNGHGHCGLRR